MDVGKVGVQGVRRRGAGVAGAGGVGVQAGAGYVGVQAGACYVCVQVGAG